MRTSLIDKFQEQVFYITGMRFVKRSGIILLFLGIGALLFGQSREVDSLMRSYPQFSGTDAEAIAHLRTIIWGIRRFDPDTAKYYFQQLDSVATASRDSNLLMEAQHITGVLHHLHGEYEQALVVFLPYMQYLERHADSVNMDRTALHLGKVYFHLGDYEKAIFYTIRARDSDYHYGVSVHHNITLRIATSYQYLGMPEKVLEEWLGYKSAWDVSEKPLVHSSALSNIAEAYLGVGEADSALANGKRALKIADQHELKTYQNKARMNMAEAYAVLDSVEQALELGERVMTHFTNMKSAPLLFFRSRKLMSKLYLDQRNYAAAKSTLDDGLKSARILNRPQDKAEMYKLLVLYYRQTGAPGRAFAYSDSLDFIQSELIDIATNSSILKVREAYETEKKDLEIALLNSKDEASQARLRRSALGLKFLVFAVISLLAIALLIFRSYRAKRKSEALLKEQNAFISKTLSEKELLLKEIHHRVKNNLQVVSSLLSLQSEFIKDDSALSAINEGRNRVKSMALIHQNLYQEDQLTGIKVREYFGKLISGLFHTYNISQERVKLIMDVDDALVDVDTIVPLGLITNELISNALKYAFPDQRAGVLQVRLRESFDALTLTVQDNGVGFDPTIITAEISSFGYQMIQAFCEKIEAQMEIQREKGTRVVIRVPRQTIHN